MRCSRPWAVLALLLLAGSAARAAEKFGVDSAHSKVGFTVVFAGVSDVEGRFTDYEATIMYDDNDLTKCSVTAVIKASSIDTGDMGRDKDLQAASWFDSEKFPLIQFQSTRVEKRGDGYVATGTLTIKGVSKEVSFPVVWRHHKMEDPWKNIRVGFEGKLTLNRRDFGVVGPTFFNNAVAGEVSVELRITAEIPNFDRRNFFAPEGKQAIGKVVGETLEKDGVEAAIKQYGELKGNTQAYQVGAGQLSLLGYKLLQHGKNQEALEIFKVNAVEYPQVAEIWDSLGDGYLATGNKEEAIRNFRKSLEMKPTNTSAMESLRSLGEQ